MVTSNVSKFTPNLFVLQQGGSEYILRLKYARPVIMYFRNNNPKLQQVEQLFLKVANSNPNLNFGVFDASSMEARRVLASSMQTRVQIRSIPFFIAYINGSPYATNQDINNLPAWVSKINAFIQQNPTGINNNQNSRYSSAHANHEMKGYNNSNSIYYPTEMNAPTNLALKNNMGMKMVDLAEPKLFEEPPGIMPYNEPWRGGE